MENKWSNLNRAQSSRTAEETLGQGYANFFPPLSIPSLFLHRRPEELENFSARFFLFFFFLFSFRGKKKFLFLGSAQSGPPDIFVERKCSGTNIRGTKLFGRKGRALFTFIYTTGLSSMLRDEKRNGSSSRCTKYDAR